MKKNTREHVTLAGETERGHAAVPQERKAKRMLGRAETSDRQRGSVSLRSACRGILRASFLLLSSSARDHASPPPPGNRLTALPCIVLLPLLLALALARDPLEPYIATPARYSFRAPARNTINRTGARHPRSQTPPRGRESISLQPQHVHVVGQELIVYSAQLFYSLFYLSLCHALRRV